MASGFFALFDDIATLMDDVASMSKIATKKTAGILGDDLAVNAEKASGFLASREIPVLWAITKGSLINKIIILPLAFLLSAFIPWIIKPILVLGGIYLAYEGVEKIFEYFFNRHKTEEKTDLNNEINYTKEDILKHEKDKIKSAIFVDFILSIEIVIIALSTVVGKPITNQIMVVSFVALLATIGVYGIVALIVRMDDFGFRLLKYKNKFSQKIGNFLVNALPIVIKSLSVIGTIALILVSGGIFVHNIDMIHHFFENKLPPIVAEIISGLLIGTLAVLIMKLFSRLRQKK
jgi:predicted DNA repair protein MutK